MSVRRRLSAWVAGLGGDKASSRGSGKTIYLHIGHYKTGTSALQAYLGKHTDALRAHGYLYPASARPVDNSTTHGHLPLTIARDHGFETPPWYTEDVPTAEVFDAFRDEIKRAPEPNIIVSSEEFIQLAMLEKAEAVLADLKARLAGFDVKVVFYIREPFSLLKSWFNEVNKGPWGSQNFPTFFAIHHEDFLSQEPIWRRYADVFGEENVIVLTYKKLGSEHIAEFLGAIGCGHVPEGEFGLIHTAQPIQTLELCRLAKDRHHSYEQATVTDFEDVDVLISKVDRISGPYNALASRADEPRMSELTPLAVIEYHHDLQVALAESLDPNPAEGPRMYELALQVEDRDFPLAMAMLRVAHTTDPGNEQIREKLEACKATLAEEAEEEEKCRKEEQAAEPEPQDARNDDPDQKATPGKRRQWSARKNSELVLHIGSHKTGSTSVQLACQEGLADSGPDAVHYFDIRPGSQRITALGGAGENFRCWIDLDAADQVFRPDAAPEEVTRFITSEEELFWIHEPDSVQDFAAMLRERFGTIRVICYLRRQDRLAFAHRKQVLERCPAALFYGVSATPLPEYQPHFQRYFDYAAKLEDIWCAAFGKENLTVIPFEKTKLHEGDIVTDMMQRTGIRMKTDKRYEENMSLSGNKTFLGLALLARGFEPEVVVRAVANLPARGTFDPTRDEARAFLAHFEEANARLARDWVFEGAPFVFDDDFSAYPEKMRDFSMEEIAEMIDRAVWSVGEEVSEKRRADTPAAR
ncbi:MAG: hypothetical protein CSA74_05100 [Rhodobacterales bacterium]|nr:MAG: hypothetical protein CSA74_05100 [Rhodobacterales bacterium]